MGRVTRTSVTRIVDLSGGYALRHLPHARWDWGQIVICEVASAPSPQRQAELLNGRMAAVERGDRIMGVFGVRAATLEATGSWEAIEDDGRLHLLTSAGLMGRMTSCSPFMAEPIELVYGGHVMIEGHPSALRDHAPVVIPRPFELPVILVVGSSMSAGKTTAARIIIRRLAAAGRRVVAGKLTGAARYRDALSMGDAGAVAFWDFSDAGLPSTVCPEPLFRQAAQEVLSRMASVYADVAVIEAGASPLEPYNGEAAVELLRPWLQMVVLCVSDPYAALGVRHAFGLEPDLVAGVACNTNAGRALIGRLTGLPALRLVRGDDVDALDALLAERLGVRRAG